MSRYYSPAPQCHGEGEQLFPLSKLSPLIGLMKSALPIGGPYTKFLHKGAEKRLEIGVVSGFRAY